MSITVHPAVEILRSAGPTVSTEESFKALGISRTLGYELIRRGEFPVRILRLGNRNRIPTAELRALLGMSEQGSPEAA